MIVRKLGFCILAMFLTTAPICKAASNELEYNVRVGVAAGAVTPLSMPAEIRSIESFSPCFNPSVEFELTRWCGSGRVGITSGVKVGKEGMSTGAEVKSYGMDLSVSGSSVSGYYTGLNRSEYEGWYLSVPLLATCRMNEKLSLRGGVYVSYMFRKRFSGYVGNGYLRSETPVGEKVEFDSDERGIYDFSGKIRPLHFGVDLGVERRVCNSLSVAMDFSLGLKSLFKSHFKTITFDMYPVYGTLSLCYSLK